MTDENTYVHSYTHEFPPAEWAVDALSSCLATRPATISVPTYGDEAAWKRVREHPLTAPVASKTVEEATAALAEPLPSYPISRYVEWTETGDREPFQAIERELVGRLSDFAVAECVERDGRFLDGILDYAWAICDRASWHTPAHLPAEQSKEGLPVAVDPSDHEVGLSASLVAQLLAETDAVFGDALPEALRRRIRTNVEERILRPFEENHDMGWMTPPVNNHNAICNANIGMAVLYLLDDPERQARILVRACNLLQHYLSGFDRDGCTAEGVSYWNYGFGRYVQLAAALEARTGGEFSLLTPPIIEKIATFPLRAELSPGEYPAFSDASLDTSVTPYAACWLGEYFDLPGLINRGQASLRESPSPSKWLSSSLRNLCWCPEREVPDTFVPSRTDFFSGSDWWIARAEPADPDGLVVAAKGGHNTESHNHNDCGTFILHHGGESIVTDTGAAVYRDGYFGEERYTYLTTRSLGHSVPYVNGYEQASGQWKDSATPRDELGAAAVLQRDQADERATFSLDLAGCYPAEAGVDSLQRTFTLDDVASGDRVIIEDDLAFEDESRENTYEFVVVSYNPIRDTGNGIEVSGDNGEVELRPASDAAVVVETLEDAIYSKTDRSRRDVWRARLTPEDPSGISLSISARASEHE